MNKLFALLCGFALVAFTLCPQVSLADEIFDFRGDIGAYCKKIAELNHEAESPLHAQSRGEDEHELVMFKTSVVPLDFNSAEFDSTCIVYGPNGFSVLICDDSVQAVEWLLEQDGVLYAEVDTTISACNTEDETSSVTYQSWAASSMGFADYSVYAGQYGSGSATIAVIDSGVYRHSLINPKIKSGGYDYVDNDIDPTNDLNGHGTRVAGIVADCTRGLPVYIYPIRVLDADASGKTSNVVSAVLEATEANVDVINLSLSTFSQSEMLEDAIRNAVASGTTVIVAAGNYSCDASEVTPANMRDVGVIVVGSADADGSRSSFSNYGTSVDVYAYGRGIVSCSRSGGYVTDSGTSMAAPHVSALCAMMELIHPSLSPYSMETRIKNAASGSIRIPSAAAMVPQQLGFSLSSIRMYPGAQLRLPLMAMPATAQEAISYQSDDPTVAEIVDGVLIAEAVGETQISVDCKGFEEIVFAIEVVEACTGKVALPVNVTVIESEAFLGMRTHSVILGPKVQSVGDSAFDSGEISCIELPATVTEIGNNDFSGAVIICSEGSFAQEYAIDHGLQYLLKMSE